ncbi:MAG TPA: DUF1232 domain-containing protein [Thermoleophilaceae bacterium]|nr:DUF1232 domain-containing protein [Thermoleophilaceae bacterium]
MSPALIVLIVALALYGALVVTLVVVGRQADARALVRLVPDCVVLFKRLLTDPRVDWWRKVVLVGVIAYVVSPIDIVPDFVPIAGQLDDAILVVIAIRVLLRGSGPRLLSEHWPGPARSLEFIRRLAY